jgi:glycosyltransferase involved in cell wall biosynthesis
MQISVIIPCHNSADTLGEQLEALARQSVDLPWEVLVVDNRSSDATVRVANGFAERLPGLRVVAALEKSGPAYARNFGAAEARGEWLLFCDGDDVVADDWLATMSRALETECFVGGRLKVTGINDRRAIDSRPGIMDLENEGVLRTHGFLAWCSSANMGIHRALFLQVGGFNEEMPALEDMDFCWRVQQLGVELVAVPASYVHYRLRTSASGIFRQSRVYAENFVLLCKRYKSAGLSAPVPSVRSLLRNWWGLVKQLGGVARGGSRGEWMWYAGWRWGCLTGSLKHRFFVP